MVTAVAGSIEAHMTLYRLFRFCTHIRSLHLRKGKLIFRKHYSFNLLKSETSFASFLLLCTACAYLPLYVHTLWPIQCLKARDFRAERTADMRCTPNTFAVCVCLHMKFMQERLLITSSISIQHFSCTQRERARKKSSARQSVLVDGCVAATIQCHLLCRMSLQWMHYISTWFSRSRRRLWMHIPFVQPLACCRRNSKIRNRKTYDAL